MANALRVCRTAVVVEVPDSIFLLLGIQSFFGIFHGSSCGSHAGLVLLYRELSLAHFDGDPVLGLLQRRSPGGTRSPRTCTAWAARFRDGMFNCSPHLGSRRVDQLVRMLHRDGTDSRGRPEAQESTMGSPPDAVVGSASAGADPVIGEKVRVQLQDWRGLFLFLAVQLDASFHHRWRGDPVPH